MGRVLNAKHYRHLTFTYEKDNVRCFCKVITTEHEAKIELAGYDTIKPFYRVPERISIDTDKKGRVVIVYEFVPGIGRDRGLFLDLINRSYSSNLSELKCFVDELTQHYFSVFSRTMQLREKENRNTKLFEDRIKKAGLVDNYYRARTLAISDGLQSITAAELCEYDVVINGRYYRFDWQVCINTLKRHFEGSGETWTVISQGDPTEINIAYPLLWLDFDNAGFNALLGEFAIFCWDTYVFGGYLVPTYSSKVVLDHPATFNYVSLNRPKVRTFNIDREARVVTIDYVVDLTSCRRMILNAYWERVIKPIVEQRFSTGWEREFANYLSLRIIGVYDIFKMEREDLAFCLAKLIEVQRQDLTWQEIFI
jgi:hypothetical protein